MSRPMTQSDARRNAQLRRQLDAGDVETGVTPTEHQIGALRCPRFGVCIVLPDQEIDSVPDIYG
jgi:hypothetical protein